MSALDFSQLLGNYGEFVGSVAIVATLIYLAVQISLANKLAKAQQHDVHRDRVRDFSLTLAQDTETARIWRVGRAGDELDEDETTRFEAMSTYNMLVQRDGWVRLTLLGMPDAEHYLDILVDSLNRFPGSRRFWETWSPGNIRLQKEFVGYVNERLIEKQAEPTTP